MGVETWYQVRFDEQGVHRAAQPPGAEPWSDSLAWADIVRVCLEVEDFVETEALYLFSRHRPESYAIPLQADGGPDQVVFEGEVPEALEEGGHGRPI